MSNPPLDVLKHVVDVHCHPTDSEIPTKTINELPIIICAMATRHNDQALVADLARAHSNKVIPCFGYHPWFAHWISITPGPPPSKKDHYRSLFLNSSAASQDNSFTEDSDQLHAFEALVPSLPEPVALNDCLTSLRRNFSSFPRAMLGEIGLDRSARVPFDYRSEQRKLSPFTIPFEHQLFLVEAQFAVAVEMQRNVSFHSVKCQKATVDLLDRMKSKYGRSWANINIDLHSCGVSPETWRDIEKHHRNVFLSLSTVINGRTPNHRKLIAAASPNRLLAESDIHEIGQCADRTWNMILTVAEEKGWSVEEHWEEELEENRWGVVRRLESNFQIFMKEDLNRVKIETESSL